MAKPTDRQREEENEPIRLNIFPIGFSPPAGPYTLPLRREEEKFFGLVLFLDGQEMTDERTRTD